MKNKALEDRFKALDFDLHEPQAGHQERFLRKLQGEAPSRPTPGFKTLWLPLISFAASLVFAVLLLGGLLHYTQETPQGELSSVSPEMKTTQDFYSALIERELQQIQAEKDPRTQAVIRDGLQQMDKLENQYQKLRQDLLISGKDSRVIHAMISNFQQRINLLEQLLDQIATIKTLNTQNHESTIM